MHIFTAIVGLLFSFQVLAVEPVAGATAAPCVFSYKPESVKVFWTGYKFTEKKGVKGEFKDLKLKTPDNAKTAEDLILGTAIDIDTLKSESGDAGRDANLMNSFFKKMKGVHITGTVTSFQSGILKVKTEMNGISKTLAFLVKMDGNKYSASTDFDMLDMFKMKKSYESISKTCAEMHKGTDGKSKTWTQVSLTLEGEVVNSCEASTAGAAGGH